MSQLSQTQIPAPIDEQAFERASVVLWRNILDDPNVQKNGRRGQRQDGVDIFGRRNKEVPTWVGIQCKCKGIGKQLTESEVRAEVDKATNFSPSLSEYFIVTTAQDDAGLQELARDLTAHYLPTHGFSVHIWGWGTVQERIAEFSEAQKAFDPSYSPFAEATMVSLQAARAEQGEFRQEVRIEFEAIRRDLRSFRESPSDEIRDRDAIDNALDSEIDRYRDR